MEIIITFIIVSLVILLQLVVVPAIILKRAKKFSQFYKYPVYLLNSDEINAFSIFSIWGKFIVVTKELIDREDEKHINAALAHEVGHLESNHHLKMLGIIVLIVILFTFFIIRYPLLILPFIMVVFISQRYLLRRFELNADNFATKIINKDLLIDLIMKYNDKTSTFLSTHPNIQVRLKNINRIK
ncbi:peptidase M48 Ste24p [Sulfolobus sp. A20]|uniref:M48 family metalloprotease n=1 Tax=Saccharolobus sp. A20 TaxID=1891280 RepID=UPI000845F3C2|nr:M48 family metallopeptidase [Sulfolobus sp. A20]TRM76341.1 peptidase M48 Ste24p [Sulfolobus sp. E5]TRM76448.1 peptidase M48 Ste24p [Sulfolobus sp. A20-N-F8]TRM76961.1 peptidase M48 Ste24p [Sulfolobus sp. B5]TRM81201.1 peptidase M48 Ste24p [Sulfolobus sp. D5]TRM83303.1 peptidase M48 Ste24p [Sulfolobus sp. A20-N-F6]TRM89754.1 peptidase M48 Ste24p [Sulfolobus sp. C3]TRN02431.1 peptidase M48 Ste24p [Sulfolobus sp. F1]